jgi:PhzF family phenazine biosynthesis protein
MNLPLYWLDAFTSEIFRGNPAAVVPLDTWLPDTLLQKIAFENGLSETAFFVRTGPARFHLRWFTPPAIEVDLCGHATLATAWTLFHQLGQHGDVLTFDSRSGPLPVSRSADGKLELDFPATPVAAENDPEVARTTTAALGQSPAWLARSRFDCFAVLPDAESVRALRPDLAQVAALGGRGLVVTAPGDSTCDFVSRFFAPQTGIPEDPVTGSAHCALMPYWATRLGKTKLHARQVSSRGGELWCEMAGDRVKIAGRCALYLSGEISV